MIPQRVYGARNPGSCSTVAFEFEGHNLKNPYQKVFEKSGLSEPFIHFRILVSSVQIVSHFDLTAAFYSGPDAKPFAKTFPSGILSTVT